VVCRCGSARVESEAISRFGLCRLGGASCCEDSRQWRAPVGLSRNGAGQATRKDERKNNRVRKPVRKSRAKQD